MVSHRCDYGEQIGYFLYPVLLTRHTEHGVDEARANVVVRGGIREVNKFVSLIGHVNVGPSAGSIPTSLGNIGSLMKLWLHNNQLFGESRLRLPCAFGHDEHSDTGMSPTLAPGDDRCL